MICLEELENKAKEFEINLTDVEKDYVFGWILYGIYNSFGLKDKLFLKGGNALRKCYFSNTRYSSDLDFGMFDDISEKELMQEINKVCVLANEKAGVTFLVSENKIKEKFAAGQSPLPDLSVYEIKIYFKDFRGNADHITLKISMDITRFDKFLLELQEKNLLHPYSDSEQIKVKVKCMKLEEIIATKLKCLMQRQHAPDLFDYVYSIKLLGGTLNKNEVVETFVKKTIFDKNPYVLKEMLKLTAFDYFRINWIKGVVCAKSILISVDDAINSFLQDMESLFSNYSDNGYWSFAYFDAPIRAKILKAGREQTLLKIIYKGDERIVEPYSLKYKEGRKGDKKEYFYVYNLQGGNSEHSIRSFIPENLSYIENTETKFEPRYPIELSKHGETPEDKYLFDPNKPLSRPSSRHLKYDNGVRYIYECSVCGKKFTRKKMDSKVTKHKSKSTDYMCYGTYGIYVDTKY